MVRHIFLDKTNTITKGSLWNTGLNPILEINYGKELSRGLIHFDVNEIGALIADGTYSDPSKLKCTLKMTNCASVDGLPYDKEIHHRASEPVERATSFDLVLYKLPQEFDAGKGFDYAYVHVYILLTFLFSASRTFENFNTKQFGGRFLCNLHDLIIVVYFRKFYFNRTCATII